ncbi:MAG: hypothetical protein KAR42_09445 [candidate division Zixibacteria bacterium]|nr:hypothetical protein [candidate division Zixibacteria bacterium]
MNRILMVALVLVFALGLFNAPVLAKKVGKITDNVFTDDNHKFSITTFEGWSTKVGSKSKLPLRLTMLEKSFPVPQAYQGGGKEDFAQIPTIRVLVDTCSTTAEQFIENLLDSKFKSKQKKFFRKNLKLISRPHEVLKKTQATIQDQKAVIYSIRQAYRNEVAQSGSDRADIINDFIAGYILYTVRDGKIYVATMLMEYKTSASYNTKWNELLSSLKFDLK